jgi:hypothetical protein
VQEWENIVLPRSRRARAGPKRETWVQDLQFYLFMTPILVSEIQADLKHPTGRETGYDHGSNRRPRSLTRRDLGT